MTGVLVPAAIAVLLSIPAIEASDKPIFPNRLMDRSMIYTALTRAAEQVIFVGDFNAIVSAVERPPVAEQLTIGFPIWMDLANNKVGQSLT
jgi:hypothetical protein